MFGIVSGKWQVTFGALRYWIPLPVSLTADLTNLYIAACDGDGNADIAACVPNAGGGQLTRWPWQFSHSEARILRRTSSRQPQVALIQRTRLPTG